MLKFNPISPSEDTLYCVAHKKRDVNETKIKSKSPVSVCNFL